MSGRLIAALAITAAVLALAGIAISGYLAVENLRGETGVCVGVGGCAEVQESRYGELFGVPVSVPGLLLYSALLLGAVGWWRDWGGQSQPFALLGFLGAFAGVAFSAYLTYVEAFVLDAWCSYCIASALLLVALFAVWAAIVWAEMRRAA